MPSTLSAFVLVFASTAAAVTAAPCHAAESGFAARVGKQTDAAARKRPDVRDAARGQAGKFRKSDKEAPRRIVTYNLFQDPVFKLNGALADKRQLAVPPVFDRLGHGHVVQPSLAARSPGISALAPVDAPALKLAEPESAGIDFSCRDKPFRSRSNPKELTACYKHNVDRSWKTQTYLSHEYSAEGSPKWGGGLAVRYAY